MCVSPVSNVIAMGSGTINTAALTNFGSATGTANLWPSVGAISVGLTAAVALVGGISGPTSFGSGPQVNASSASGTITALLANLEGQNLYVPSGYTSHSALSGTATWNNQTLASLGLVSGTYT
jgi:hypothetical protein